MTKVKAFIGKWWFPALMGVLLANLLAIHTDYIEAKTKQAQTAAYYNVVLADESMSKRDLLELQAQDTEITLKIKLYQLEALNNEKRLHPNPKFENMVAI